MKSRMAAAFAAQGYISLLGLILVPYYLSLVGAAAFGLIGFFMLLQNLLPVLDLGFTQALAREMSRFRAGLLSDREVWSRLRSIEWLLGAIITSAASITIFFSGWIATEWLQSSAISMEIVVSSVVAMAIAIGLRWSAGIYRAALIGMDRQALVNVGGVALATLRFVGVVPVLVHCSASPLAFFYYQVGAAACELLAYLLAVYRSLPPLPERAQPNIAVMRGLRPMASSMGLLALISMLTTQVDKLILSRTLPLEQFGHFVLVSVVAGAATILLGPINQTLQPRLTILAEQHDIAGLRDLYLTASQFVSSVYCAIGVTFAVFAHPLLRAWTGDDSIADFAAPILTWYGPAASLSGILLLPFMLQFAFGQLRLHIIGNVAQLLIMVPAISSVPSARAAWARGRHCLPVAQPTSCCGSTWYTGAFFPISPDRGS